jgi:NAD(P)-dependent dehydrogenase (short-subunit alcohol dehydrogenase family)
MLWAVGLTRSGAGCIINISSVLGLHKQTPGNSVYAATKAGVIGLTRTLAAELGPAGVRTNAIVPGYIETDMTAGMTEDSKEKALKATPLGRLGRVDEIADTAVFLAESGFINGAEIVVDGGLRCS